MRRIGILLSVVGLGAVALMGAACDSDSEGEETGATSPVVQIESLFPGGTSLGASELSRALAATNQQSGIWVTGLGEVTITPDLALLSLGVEAQEATVAQAQDQAARAMDAVVKVLRDSGVAPGDIQTRFFNIQPEYTFEEVRGLDRRSTRRVLVGYRVTNTVTVKVRDLESVGSLVDQVAKAGGDLVRVNSISFTLDDATSAQREAREKAVQDALEKAQQFATLTGVSVGDLMFISEGGGGVPAIRNLAAARVLAEAAPVPTTPISPGELEVRVVVQAVFGIE